MKNFALLLSSLTVASAFAAAPEVSQQLGKVSGASLETAKVVSKSVKSGKVLSEKNAAAAKVLDAKKAPMKAEGFSVSYEEPAGIFSLGLSEDVRSLRGTYRKGPAYTPLTWINTSVGATEFEWEVPDFETNGTKTIQAVDLEYAESYSITTAPILYGMDSAGNTGIYQFGAEVLSDTELSEPTVGYFFGGDCAPSDIDCGMTTYMYGQNDPSAYTTFGVMGYNKVEKEYYNTATGLDYIFTDPESERGYGLVDPKFKGFANVFNTPASPYLITKMWSWFVFKATKASVIELTLYKIDEEGYITDEVIAAGETAVEASKGNQEGMLTFELYALDEDGLQTDEPIVIDSAFVAVMTFNADDFDSVYPVSGGGALCSVEDPITYPTHAYIAIEDAEGLGYYRSPYRYYNQDQTQLMAVTDFMWMVDACFPWSYVIDNSVAQAPVEGGMVTFNISSYYSIQYFSFMLPEDCDWIDFENATIGQNADLQCETVNFPVAALPEGVEGRSVVIEVEGIGSNFTMTINQGEGNAVSVIVTETGAQYFDLQGRRVANPENGIFIKKTGNKTEKVIL